MKYLYSGGLQIRSEEAANSFYRIDTFLKGELALHKLYKGVEPDDIPIAQDCFGDQFLIRKGKVFRLYAETGELEPYDLNWEQFLEWVNEDPIERLEIDEDLDLEVGKLLFAYPPFCTKEGENARINPIDGKEVIRFHAKFAKELSALEDGQQIKLEIIE